LCPSSRTGDLSRHTLSNTKATLKRDLLPIADALIRKPIEIERAFGVETPSTIRMMVIDAEDCALQMQKRPAIFHRLPECNVRQVSHIPRIEIIGRLESEIENLRSCSIREPG
jgi:hypothetical protein